MLSLLGFVTVGSVIALIMSKKARMSPYIAMIVVPFIAALIGGFAFNSIGSMAVAGITRVMQIALLILFSVLYFGVMMDAGLFDPFIERIGRSCKGDPLKIILGSTVLAMIIAVAGDGAITYMITLTAMLPFHRKLGINPVILPAVTLLSVGVITNTPWSPPIARVIGVLHLEPAQILTPMMPIMFAGAAAVLVMAYIMGVKERARLGIVEISDEAQDQETEKTAVDEKKNKLKRPHLFWVNVVLTAALLFALVIHLLPHAILFMLALGIALLINYPKVEDQKSRILEHAGHVLYIVVIILAAGVFAGILAGTKMTDAMAHTLVAMIPDALGPHFSLITALMSMPILFLMSIDSFVFGVVPILAKTASVYGISAAEIGRASIMGHPVNILSPLVPNIFLLTGLAGVSLAELQRFAIVPTILASIAMTIMGVMVGAFSL